MHLGHIAKMFADGDFNIPIFVHDAAPPGVPEMKELQKRIHYTFEETPDGGRVIIATSDKTAVDAVHRFLRFQIQEHHTGDPQQQQATRRSPNCVQASMIRSRRVAGRRSD
jgi:hypothetical protein